MSENRITQNNDVEEKKRLTGSLTQRVFFISFIFLVIPLLIYSVFLYVHELEDRKNNLFASLNILGDNRVLIVEQTIGLQQRFLNSVITRKNFIQYVYSNEFGEEANAFLQKMSERMGVLELDYLAYEKGSFTLKASSNRAAFAQNFNQLEVLSPLLQQSLGAFVCMTAPFNKDNIYVTKTIYDTELATPIGLIVAAIEAKPFIKQLASMDSSLYPIEISLIIDEKIVISSASSFSSEKSLLLHKVKKTPDGYEFDLDKQQYYAVMLPIKESNFQLLLSVEKKAVSAVQHKKYFFELGIFLVLIFLVGGAVTLLLIFRIAKPLKELFEVMRKVSRGDIHARFKKDKMGFEINLLGRYFNEMVDSLIAHQKKVQEERLQKLSYQQELKIGHDIQKGLLPKSAPHIEGIDIAFHCIFAQEVGGDFYDLFMLEGKLVFLIADTAGKGISACLYALTLRSMLKSFISSEGDLRKAIEKTNDLFCSDTEESSSFVTAWIGIYDPQTKTVQFNSSGHFPALLHRDNGVMEPLNSKGMALGAQQNIQVEIKQVQLESHDTLVLYTDGIIEAMNPRQQLYGTNRLKKVINTNANLDSKDLINKITSDVNTFVQDAKQSDDIAVLVIKVL